MMERYKDGAQVNLVKEKLKAPQVKGRRGRGRGGGRGGGGGGEVSGSEG